MSIKETLDIKNFFTISDFKWDIRGFNLLTGGMGSGKSLCLKLLYFLEQIFHETVFYSPITRDGFQKKVFYNTIRERFGKIFFSNDPQTDYRNTRISYSFTYESTVFDLLATWDENTKQLCWTSKYITERLEQWQSYFKESPTPDMAESVRTRIYESILSDFKDSFPVGAMFIPASRAIAAISENKGFTDSFLSDFMALKEFVLSLNNVSSVEDVNNILHIKNMAVEISQNVKTLKINLEDGRNISPLQLSSGQQELIYLLLLVKDLPRTRFSYGKGKSIFIEEPSTHLFPKEQKETVEFIIKMFNELQRLKENSETCRFFISTHSPYVLNVLNNILDKGRLLKRIDSIIDEKIKSEKEAIINNFSFPYLLASDVSAYMIESTGHVSPMLLGDDDAYLYSSVIEQITKDISEETDKLYNLNREIEEYFKQQARDE